MRSTPPNTMNGTYGFNDTMVENILGSVLSDIDQLMFTESNNPSNISSTFNHGPMYGSSQHSSYAPICNIDKLLMEELPTIPNNHNNNSPSTISSNSPITPYNNNNIDHYLPDIHNNVLIQTFKPQNKSKLQLKDHIFISKDVTYRLGQYIVKENWSKQCSLLYKYLDYIFRCQCFNQQIIEIYHQKK
eukprot:756654_1